MKRIFGIIILAVIGISIGLILTTNGNNESGSNINTDKQQDIDSKQDTNLEANIYTESNSDDLNQEDISDISSNSDTNETVDLTNLSTTMVYAEVYNMLMYPEEYRGRTIKMKGEFVTYENPADGKVATACLIMDATACCAQGIEFVLEGDKVFPDDYPELNSEIVVIGTYDTYEEEGQLYCHLIDATLE